VGFHSSVLNIVSKYSVWVIDSVVMKGAIGAAEVIQGGAKRTHVF